MKADALKLHPLTIAVSLALLVGGGFIGFEKYTQPVLKVPAIDRAHAPHLDGDISDDVWNNAKPVTVATEHGGDFGGSGETAISVRAVHDDGNIYLAFTWHDPTRSLQRLPLVKEDGTWHVIGTNYGKASETRFYSDRLAVMLAASGRAIIGAAIHLAQKPLPQAPGAITGRGLHYTPDGTSLDLWDWDAAINGVTAHVQDNRVGPPLKPTVAQEEGVERYAGGIRRDPGVAVAGLNFVYRSDNDSDRDIVPLRLPETFGTDPLSELFNGNPAHSAGAGEASRWALPISRSRPYSAEIDAEIPDGTIIPGVLVNDELPATGDDVVSAGQWAGGHWVVEFRRSLRGGETDVQIKTGTLMWLAAFDHSQTRHTYHLRPLKLELE